MVTVLWDATTLVIKFSTYLDMSLYFYDSYLNCPSFTNKLLWSRTSNQLSAYAKKKKKNSNNKFSLQSDVDTRDTV